MDLKKVLRTNNKIILLLKIQRKIKFIEKQI